MKLLSYLLATAALVQQNDCTKPKARRLLSRRLNGGNTLPISVRLIDGQLHALEVPSDDTVKHVINIAHAAGLSEVQALSFGGERLKEDDQLSETGICAKSVLNEVLRAPRFWTHADPSHCYSISENEKRVKMNTSSGFSELQISMDPRQHAIKFRIIIGGTLQFEINDCGSGDYFAAGDIVQVVFDFKSDTWALLKNGEKIWEDKLSRIPVLRPSDLSDAKFVLSGGAFTEVEIID